MTDCIVVGGGLMGMLTARELAKAGLAVSLLDKGALGRESSWAGGGILSPLYPWRYDQAIQPLARWSQQVYPSLVKELQAEGCGDAEWSQSGLLILDPDDPARVEEWTQRFQSTLEWCSDDAVRKLEPALTLPSNFTQAVWLENVAQVRNPRLLKALRQSLEQHGVEIRSEVEVFKVLQQKNRISGVETSVGTLAAECVVMCSGAWTGDLLKGLKTTPEVSPVRGQMLLFRGAAGALKRIVLSAGHYVIPRQDGRVLVGSSMERVGFDKSVTDAVYHELKEIAYDLFPILQSAEIEAHWSGLRPEAPKGVPYLGEHPDLPGLYVNAGHFRNGLVLGPASAQTVADLVLQRPLSVPDLNLQDYALDRGAMTTNLQ
ncbi:MAG TPA: glycine oxidase ThiO [Myxococcales bacterium]|nr:glycine oxidase ThiO [Myxococcales bacterium]